MTYERNIIYKDKKYNGEDIKKQLEAKGYKDIFLLHLKINEKIYAIINNKQIVEIE